MALLVGSLRAVVVHFGCDFVQGFAYDACRKESRGIGGPLHTPFVCSTSTVSPAMETANPLAPTIWSQALTANGWVGPTRLATNLTDLVAY